MVGYAGQRTGDQNAIYSGSPSQRIALTDLFELHFRCACEGEGESLQRNCALAEPLSPGLRRIASKAGVGSIVRSFLCVNFFPTRRSAGQCESRATRAPLWPTRKSRSAPRFACCTCWTKTLSQPLSGSGGGVHCTRRAANVLSSTSS